MTLLLGSIVSCAFAQAPQKHLGLLFDASGIRTEHPASDRLAFLEPLPTVLPIKTYSPAIQLQAKDRLRIHLTSTASPFLSWSEGSIGSGLPTPSAPWLLLSFQDSQPPLLFNSQEGLSATLQGVPGDWTLEITPVNSGVIQVSAPFGTIGKPTRTAAELGDLTQKFRNEEAFWTKSPALVESVILEEPNAITEQFSFDRSGALLPPAALLAQLGGYTLKIDTGYYKSQARTTEGPVFFAMESNFSMRFPCRKIPSGRSLIVGSPWLENGGGERTVPSLVNCALNNLFTSREGALRDEGAMHLRWALRQLSSSVFLNDASLDQAAALDMLQEAIRWNSQKIEVLFKKIDSKFDLYSFKLQIEDRKIARRAAAIEAVASLYQGSSERRLFAAKLQAGLCAERGLMIWKKRQNEPTELLLEPIERLRQTLFCMDASNGVGQSLLSPIRILSPHAVKLTKLPQIDVLEWQTSQTSGELLISVESGPFSAEAQPIFGARENLMNYSYETASPQLLILRYQAKEPGKCTLQVSLPQGIAPLPWWTGPLEYEETER